MPCGFKSRPRYYMNIRPLVRKIRRALTGYAPLITISISRERLLHNFRAYKERYPSMGIAPVLKSNAYGHGLEIVARILDREGIAFFMVDSLYEATVLRRVGIQSRIVVMGYVRPEYIARSSVRDTEYAVVDIEQLRTLARLATSPVRIHLKLDTGMHRQGILPADVSEAIGLIRANQYLRVTGIATHLADADNKDAAFTKTQLAAWNDTATMLDAAFPSIEYRHAAATKGALWSATHPMNVLRLGMGLYGYDSSPEAGMALTPALSMRTSITSARAIPAGDTVGYNSTFVATRPSRIATVPVGYYEGIDRGLSNKGSLLVRGVACPIAGRVSMNMTSIDVTDVPDTAPGDEVLVISHTPEDPNSVRSMALLADTTPYVILAHLPSHLYRTEE